MVLESGALYSCKYLRWHNDSNPLLFVFYSDHQYTIGFNVHYIKKEEYPKLAEMLNKINTDKRLKKKFFVNNRKWYYDFLKEKFPDFIEQAYRMYFTGLMTAVRVNPVLRTREIGSKWREPRKIPQAAQHEKLRYRASKDKKLKALSGQLKYQGFTKSKIKLNKEYLRRYYKL